MVQSGVNKDTTIIPSSRFDSDSLVNQGALDKRFVGDSDGYLSVLYPSNTRDDPLCLLRRATLLPSVLQTTYLTGGVVNSARTFCC